MHLGQPSRAPIWVWVRSPDALLTSWMALSVDPTLALGTLQTLARYQGSREDALTEEQPGRILHEVRLGAEGALALGGGRACYGTADATPLFVALLGELHRCGLPETEVAAFLPAADRALEWIDTYGDPNGDGSLSIGGPPTAAWSTRAEGLLRRDQPGPTDPGRAAHRARRGAGLCVRGIHGPRGAGRRARRPGPGPGTGRSGLWPSRRRSTSGLDAAAAGLRGRPGRGGGPGRRRHVEQGPLSVVRQHRRGKGPGGRPAPARAAAVDRFRRAHAGRRHGRLQPGELPQRFGVPHDSAIDAAGVARYGYRVEAQWIGVGLLDAAQPQTRQWHQAWADSNGALFNFVGIAKDSTGPL